MGHILQVLVSNPYPKIWEVPPPPLHPAGAPPSAPPSPFHPAGGPEMNQ